MRILKVLWRVAVNVIALLVVLAMFRVAHSQFETVVIGGLTLIYVSAMSSFSWVGRAVVEGNHRHAAQFVEIAQLLKHPEIEDYTELLNEQADELRKTTTAFWINAGFNSILWFVALWKLVGAVGNN